MDRELDEGSAREGSEASPESPIEPGTTGKSSDAHLPLTRALGLSLAAWDALDPEAGPGRRTLEHARQFVVDPPVFNALGLPLTPVTNPDPEVHYEVALLRRGDFAFRLSTWHDWFNLLSWRVWPRSKAALNLRHNLHYQLQLERLRAGRARHRHGARIPRDDWMQVIAMLDEGGCIVTEAVLRDHARLNDRNTWVWHSIPPDEVLAREVRWFGHAVLENLALGRPAPPLRMWVTALPEVCDDLLARRILTFDPALEPAVRPLLSTLDGVLPWYLDAIRFASGDPFRRPVLTIYSPWEGHTGERP